MNNKGKQRMQEREIIEEIVRLLSSMDARKTRPVFGFVWFIKCPGGPRPIRGGRDFFCPPLRMLPGRSPAGVRPPVSRPSAPGGPTHPW